MSLGGAARRMILKIASRLRWPSNRIGADPWE